MPAMLPHSERKGLLLDPELCWPLLSARDSRADGRFVVGVSSTGIYCRPICVARTPRRENCRFYATPAAAEQAGFRPCLRCRPELAPGHASVDAPVRLAQAAAALIEEGLMQQGGLPAIATRLGVTDRHLRRVFLGQFGVAPIAYAQTQRLLMAKRLLTDTAMSMTDVAMAAGFDSLRRFNDSFARRYRMSPSALRRVAATDASSAASPSSAGEGLLFRLAYRPPLDWRWMLGFLAHRQIDGTEWVDCPAGHAPGDRLAGSYRRIVRLPGRAPGEAHTGWVEVRHAARAGAAGHLLLVRLDPALARVIPALLGRLRRAFDLNGRPDEIAAVLGPLAHGHEGVRLPGAFDGFEIAVRAILGQQVTVAQARRMAHRLVCLLGDPVPTPWAELTHAFPTPARIARCTPDELRGVGLLRSRSEALIGLSQALEQGALRLDTDADVGDTLERLRSIRGIGDWTAQYVALRALGWPDAFPAADVGVMKSLGVRTAAQATRAADAWRPWRGYAVMHLWRRLSDPPPAARQASGTRKEIR